MGAIEIETLSSEGALSREAFEESDAACANLEDCVKVLKAALDRISMIKMDEDGPLTTLEQAVHVARAALSGVEHIENNPASTRQCEHPVHKNPGLVAPCPECGADDAA